jgi:hypothetical protein
LAAVRADTGLRVFVVDTTRSFYGGWPDNATLAWLERDLHEVTAEVAWGPARARPLRIFVR